ncbi:unnamed protein product [Cylindrotheca closterium]|uniref:30S ribosomal protein S15 n=1 Tax=Cylindrotheca closterium TaxID=2856 RepID=A0AAD2CSE2_9STRA|nr:unnamed protein product [Cylindrotheca closterium]
MFSSTLARRSSAALTSTVWSNKVSALPAVNVVARQCFDDFKQQPQVRTMVTKKRVHRQEKRQRKEDLAAQGVSTPKPHMYMPVDTPVINAVSREERDAESKRSDELAAQELKERMEVVKEPLLRFGFSEDNLKMSDRVKKLFDLQNGNQQEVIKAQKKRGMELFQMREGDTGSSGVQVIALTTRIQQIQTHLRQHKKDKHSKRGLDALYVRRRKLLDYMERKDFESYRKVVKTLGLIH